MSDTSRIPAVSVGIPVYNGEAFVGEAIASILAQTFTDFELVISDNASTDRTEQICREFAAADPRIRYIRQPENMGATLNFIHVMEVSRARYFKWAAHDDAIAPTFLERCVEVLDSDAGCLLVYPRTIIIDEHGRQTIGYLDFMASDSEDAAGRFRRFMFPGPAEPNPIFGLMRREPIQKAWRYGIYTGADHVFLGKVALMGRTRVINEALFLRRIHPGISVNTHPDDLSREEFHTGKKARGLRFQSMRVFREYARAIGTTPMSASERLGCYRILLRKIWRARMRLAKELALPLYANGQPTAFGRWLFYLVNPQGKLRSDR